MGPVGASEAVEASETAVAVCPICERWHLSLCATWGVKAVGLKVAVEVETAAVVAKTARVAAATGMGEMVAVGEAVGGEGA